MRKSTSNEKHIIVVVYYYVTSCANVILLLPYAHTANDCVRNIMSFVFHFSFFIFFFFYFEQVTTFRQNRILLPFKSGQFIRFYIIYMYSRDDLSPSRIKTNNDKSCTCSYTIINILIATYNVFRHGNPVRLCVVFSSKTAVVIRVAVACPGFKYCRSASLMRGCCVEASKNYELKSHSLRS